MKSLKQSVPKSKRTLEDGKVSQDHGSQDFDIVKMAIFTLNNL